MIDVDALEALRSRLRHTEAVARLASRAFADRQDRDAIEGIAETLEEQGTRLDAIIRAAATA